MPSGFSIPYHLRSEANIQAHFFSKCWAINLPCVLELYTPFGRLDAVIFTSDWKRILAVVEVKRRDDFSKLQINRYKRLGVPVFGLCKMERAERLANQIKRDYYKPGDTEHGQSFEGILAHKKLFRGSAKPINRMELDPDLIVRD